MEKSNLYSGKLFFTLPLLVILLLLFGCVQIGESINENSENQDLLLLSEVTQNEVSIPDSWKYSGPERIFIPFPFSMLSRQHYSENTHFPFQGIDRSVDRALSEEEWGKFSNFFVSSLMKSTDTFSSYSVYFAYYGIVIWAALDQHNLSPSESLVPSLKVYITPRMIDIITRILPKQLKRKIFKPGIFYLPSFHYRSVSKNDNDHNDFDFIVDYQDNQNELSGVLAWNISKNTLGMSITHQGQSCYITYDREKEECIFLHADMLLKIKAIPQQLESKCIFTFRYRNSGEATGSADNQRGYFFIEKEKEEGYLMPYSLGGLSSGVNSNNNPYKEFYLTYKDSGSADELSFSRVMSFRDFINNRRN